MDVGLDHPWIYLDRRCWHVCSWSGVVGADSGAGNAAENIQGLCNHTGWSLGMWADNPGQDLLPFDDLGL